MLVAVGITGIFNDVNAQNVRAQFPGSRPAENTSVPQSQPSAAGSSINLAGRSPIGSLPKPRYEGNNEGRVIVAITVDARGNVINAKYMAQGSTTSDNKLITAAVNAAKQARFNADPSAPASQNGTITYVFTFNADQKVLSQSNKQAFVIASEAITKYDGAEQHLLDYGLRFVRDDTQTPYETYKENPEFCYIRRSFYADDANRLWAYSVIGVPESDHAEWRIFFQFEFSSSASLNADMESAGFTMQGIDQDTNDIIWRKYLYTDEDGDKHYVMCRMLVLNMNGRYIGACTFYI